MIKLLVSNKRHRPMYISACVYYWHIPACVCVGTCSIYIFIYICRNSQLGMFVVVHTCTCMGKIVCFSKVWIHFLDILGSINKKYYYLSVKMAKNVTCKQCSKQAGEVNSICCDACDTWFLECTNISLTFFKKILFLLLSFKQVSALPYNINEQWTMNNMYSSIRFKTFRFKRCYI